MENKERNILILANSIAFGIFLLIYPIPVLLIIIFSYEPLFYFSSYPIGYIALDLILLIISLYLYGYFLIKPVDSESGKKKIAFSSMILGGVLFIIPLISLSIETYYIYIYILYGEIFVWFYFDPIISLALLMPGIALFIHGRFLRKKCNNLTDRNVKEMIIHERNTIISFISLVSGIFITIYFLPHLIIFIPHAFSLFSRLYGLLYIDFLILAIGMFIYSYFLKKPIKTLSGKIKLGWCAIILGGILICILSIAVSFEIGYRFYYGYNFDVFDRINIILCVIVLLPALMLIFYGSITLRTLKKESMEDNLKKMKKILFIILSISFEVILAIFANPYLGFFFSNILLFFTELLGFLYLDYIILLMILIIFTYFIIKPLKSQSLKDIIAKIALIFGSILFIFAIIAIIQYISYFGFSISYFAYLYLFFQCLIGLLPGISMIIHGWFLILYKRGIKYDEYKN